MGKELPKDASRNDAVSAGPPSDRDNRARSPPAEEAKEAARLSEDDGEDTLEDGGG